MQIINLFKEEQQIRDFDISRDSLELINRVLWGDSVLSLSYYYKHWKNISFDEENSIVKFNGGVGENTLYRTLNQIPIYLVTTDQCNKSFSVDFFGRRECVCVPEDKYVPEDNIGIIYDLLGVYISAKNTPINSSTLICNSKPIICIWVDKIWEICNRNWHNYQLLLSKVILHELIHGMMDVTLLGYNYFKSKPEEESLANAIPLLLLKEYVTPTDWEFLAEFVKSQ